MLPKNRKKAEELAGEIGMIEIDRAVRNFDVMLFHVLLSVTSRINQNIENGTP